MSWTTIESDPGVFHELLQDFGVKDVSLEELWSLDADSFTPFAKPIYGLFFLFKYQKRTRTGGGEDAVVPDGLFFAHQVISNACGTLALLHVVMNADGIDAGPVLGDFRAFTEGMDPTMRGMALEQCDPIRTAHNSFARPEPFLHEDRQAGDDDDVFHFIAYVPKGGVVYELDGLAAGPVSLGTVPEGGDWIPVATRQLEMRIAEYSASEIRFNLLALTGDPLVAAKKAAGACLGRLRALHPRVAAAAVPSPDDACAVAGVTVDDVDADAVATAEQQACASSASLGDSDALAAYSRDADSLPTLAAAIRT